MKIRFVKNYKVKQGDGNGPEYRTGQVVDFSGPVDQTYGQKYVRLGLAEEVDERAERKAAAEARAKEEDARAKVEAAARAEEAKAKAEVDAKAKAEAERSAASKTNPR